MQKFKIYILAVLITVGSLGCSDSFLDLAPLSNANASGYYKSTTDFDVAVNAAYATLYTIYGPEGPMSYCAEQMSDNCTLYQLPGAAGDLKAFKDYTLQSANTQVYLFWRQYYSALFDLNKIITELDASSLSTGYKASVTAQMKFLRALYYFGMVQMWGDLPIVTSPVSAAESYKIVRSSAADVYKLIVEDLKFSVNTLPPGDKVARPGMASKGAAEMLLAKVYMTLGDNASAEVLLMDVYNSGIYSLMPDYEDLWGTGTAHKNTKESIFEVQYKGGVSNPYSKYWTQYTPTDNSVITKFGKGMNQVTDDLYNEYEAGDPRRDISISPGYNDAQGNYKAIKYVIKWKDSNAPLDGSVEAADNNFMVLRYSDLLLLLSEVTGNPQYLNQVRARAGLPLYGTDTYPARYGTLDLAVEHERRVELAIEFHRWFDLKRTGRAPAVLSAAKGKQISDQMLLLPIPLIVTTQNPQVQQNPGY